MMISPINSCLEGEELKTNFNWIKLFMENLIPDIILNSEKLDMPPLKSGRRQ